VGGRNRHRPSLGTVIALAERQHGVVTRAQLLAAGLSSRAIEHRLKTGRLHSVHRAVFAVGRPALTREGLWLAAVLACGEGAALSYLHAGALWGIWERGLPSRPHVSVPSAHGRRGPRGVQLHRTAIRAGELTVRDSIPVTVLERTLADLAGILTAKRLKSALRQAERLHRLDLSALRASLDASPSERGEAHAPSPSSMKHARLRRALDTYVPGAANTEADVEMAFLELCVQYALPSPRTQEPVGPYRADFMWRELGLVVEIDDRQSHDGYVAFHQDRVRDRTMKAAGLEVLRFTRVEVLTSSAAVAREVAEACARRARLARPR
jgi:very-short-patch-repair endonuclease